MLVLITLVTVKFPAWGYYGNTEYEQIIVLIVCK